MNLLVDAPPESVEINGQEWQINYDFKSCLRIILAFEDNELSSLEKQSIMISNLYPVLPTDVKAAIEKGGWFLNGGQEKKEDNESALRLYSFAKDYNLIFAAFRQTHDIDLKTARLHWWEFLALFMDLGSETTFCNLVSLRKRVMTGRASKEEKQTAREIGEIFDVPEIDDRTLEEREAEQRFLEIIGANK